MKNRQQSAMLAWASSIALALCSTVALACSPSSSDLSPSNYELVEQTSVIVVAQPVRFFRRPESEDEPGGSVAEFTVLEVVKGQYPAGVLIDDAIEEDLGRSKENDLSGVRAGALAGACNAQDYMLGRKYLLFLNEQRNRLHVSGPAFARINEEVADADSVWLAAVKHYVRIAALNDYESEKKALQSLRDAAKAGTDRNVPAALAADIDHHFQQPYPTKSYADLMSMYERGSEQHREKVLWALLGHAQAATLFQSLTKSPQWRKHLQPLSAYAEATGDREVIMFLASQYPSLRGQGVRWPVMWALVRRAQDEDREHMVAAFKSAGADEQHRLATWFERFPDQRVLKVIKAQVGADYLQQWQLAFAMSGMGDPEILQWAKGFASLREEDRWIAFYVIAHSPLPAADELARQIIGRNDPAHVGFLIEGYGDSQSPNRWARLQEIAVGSADPTVKRRLRQTLERMAQDGDAKASIILAQLR